VVVFLSAHGVRDSDKKYHLVTYDFDLTDPRPGITEEDLEALFDQVPARKASLYKLSRQFPDTLCGKAWRILTISEQI